jgi:GMP synthase (glutamine-hydrolysing)
MQVLIIKNVFSEGPGTIEDHLRAKNIPYMVADLSVGDAAPELSAFTHLVVMGGPMAVYEMHKHPYLVSEALLLDRAIRANKAVLGVCLGAQMLAHVLGARVYPGKKKEIGWYNVRLSAEGASDPVMSPLAIPGTADARVFQWHGDTFDLPKDAVRLASSELYPNQAFRFKDRVYALQFHIEVTPGTVRGWLEHEKGIDFAKISAESDEGYDAYRDRAGVFYERFFSI